MSDGATDSTLAFVKDALFELVLATTEDGASDSSLAV